MRRVLVIREGPDQAKALALRLGLLGLETAASAGELALAMRSIFGFTPHLILFDSNTVSEARDVFGFLLQAADIPIVVIGDTHPQDDLVWYLEQGAADFVSTLTSDTVLTARIKAILRRMENVEGRGVIEVGSLEIDTERYQVRKRGEPVQLTPTEFRILRVLAEHAGKPCGHRMLLEQVWGEEFRQCSHYLRLYVGYIRQKIEADPKRPRLLLTEWGIGYRLVPDEAPSPASPPIRARLITA